MKNCWQIAAVDIIIEQKALAFSLYGMDLKGVSRNDGTAEVTDWNREF